MHEEKVGAIKKNPYPGTSFHYGGPPQAPLSLGRVLEKVVLGVGLCQPQVVLGVPPKHASGGALGALAQTRCGAWVCFGAPPTHQIA